MLFWVSLLFALSTVMAQGNLRLVASRYLGNSVVYSAAFSSNGSQVAAVTLNTIHLFDPTTFEEVRQMNTGRWNLSVSYSPNNYHLATGDGPGTGTSDYFVRLWDAQTGQPINQMAGHTDSIWSVAFSPDGGLLASASRDSTVRLWEIPSGQAVATIPAATQGSVAFSTSGVLATTNPDGTILLWRAPWKAPIERLTAPDQRPTPMAFSPNGALLFAHGNLWSIGPERSVLSGSLPATWPAVFLPDNRTLIVSGLEGSLRSWDYQTFSPSRALLSGQARILGLAVSPSGNQLVLTSEGGRLLFLRYQAGPGQK